MSGEGKQTGKEERKEHEGVNVEGMQVDKTTMEASSPYLYLLSHIKVQGVKRMTVWTEAGRENPGGSLKQRTCFAGCIQRKGGQR